MERLMKPWLLEGMTLRNRLIMAPAKTAYGTVDSDCRRMQGIQSRVVFIFNRMPCESLHRSWFAREAAPI